MAAGRSPPVTAFYGVTYFFWYYAVTTEQYTSAVAWTLAVVLLAFRWERERRDGYLLALALLMGVALAHMVTLLFIAPPLLWFVLRTEPKLLRRPRLIAAVVALALLPLLSYVFVYVRGAQHPEWRGVGQWVSTGQWFLSFLSTRQGRDELTWSLRPFLRREFPALIWRELTWPGLIAGHAGSRGDRPAPGDHALRDAGHLPGVLLDRPAGQLVPGDHAGVCAAGGRAGRGRGVALAESAGSAASDERSRRDAAMGATGRRSGAMILGLAVLVIYRGVVSYPRADSSRRAEDTGLQPGWAILADDPPAGTAVLGTLGETLALNYLTEIWGVRPDVRSITSAQAQKLLAAGAPVAVTAAALPLVPAEVSPAAHYSALGRTLVAVSATPPGICRNRERRRWANSARGCTTSAVSCSSWRDASAPTAPRARPSRC